MLDVLKSIVLFVILLSVIVSIHEFGHLIAAKIFKVYCHEYSIGMGPKIYSRKGKETIFSIRAFPIGGFVSMAGDNENALETSVDVKDIDPSRTLKGIAKWKRIIIMLSGILMNFILALVIFSLIICFNGTYAISTKPQVVTVVKDSPAEVAGILENDIIQKVSFENGMSFSPENFTELVTFLSAYDGNGDWIIEVDRNGETVKLSVTPKYNSQEKSYLIGISFSNTAVEFVETNIFNCWIYGFEYVVMMIKMILVSFMTIFTPGGVKNLSGVVGIYQTVDEVASYGLIYYIQLIGMISLNVGIFNAIPLPIFDGGRVLLLIIEAIIRRPLNKKAENFIMSLSAALVILLFLYVTFNDVLKIFGG